MGLGLEFTVLEHLVRGRVRDRARVRVGVRVRVGAGVRVHSSRAPGEGQG